MTGEVMDGGTCGESYCQEQVPPAGMETAFGGYVVGGVYYCAMHGYGRFLKAKRQQKQADWERGKTEFDRRRKEKQAAQAEAAQTEQKQQKQRRGSWVDRLAAYAAHVDAVKAEKTRRP